MFRSPDPGTLTYGWLAGLALGLYLCIRPPGLRMTLRRLMTWVAVVAVVLGLLAWSASKEHVVMVSRQPQPDGSTVLTVRYANGFGATREVRTVER